jgi:hypothetical protein
MRTRPSPGDIVPAHNRYHPEKREKKKQASNHHCDAWMPVHGKEMVAGKSRLLRENRIYIR